MEKAKACTVDGTDLIFDIITGVPKKNFQGLCLVYCGKFTALFRTWYESGERQWYCIE